ncbi:MAG: alcohol dehydrogenase catalytic domain-containing protein [Pseudonocardiaceae bacterium]|nr:alcohol dehydrogenase catalytic domain-containing protein [Pseudonocardiaceae bacterium]
MRGLIYRGPYNVAVVDVADPVLRDEFGAVVRVSTAGICGSDLHIYEGHGFSDDTGFCLGHEAVGEVMAVGERVTNITPGMRVLVPGSVGCSLCRPCRAGRVARCHNNSNWLNSCYGLHAGLPGSQAGMVAVPHAETNLVPLPFEVSDAAGILLADNAPTAWYGARRARIAYGDTVAVIGLGPVGLMAVQSALIMGAARVLAVDLLPERRERSVELGAEPIEGDDVKAALRAATGGRGPEVAIEAVGTDATIELALKAVRLGGRVSVVGVSHNRAFPMHMQVAQVKELEFAIGLCSVQYELPTLLALTTAGRLRPEAVISHRLPLSDGAEAYKMFAAREDGVSKILLDPDR